MTTALLLFRFAVLTVLARRHCAEHPEFGPQCSAALLASTTSFGNRDPKARSKASSIVTRSLPDIPLAIAARRREAIALSNTSSSLAPMSSEGSLSSEALSMELDGQADLYCAHKELVCRMEFPLATVGTIAKEERVAVPSDKPAASRVRRLRVLVVEDETMLGLLLEGMLEELGHEVVGPIAHLAKALKIAQQEVLDLAILDVNIKGQESYPVAEGLAARKIPFAFSTGYELMRLREAYRKAPILQKPFRLDNLERLIGKLVPHRQRSALPRKTSSPSPSRGGVRRGNGR